MPEKGSVRRTFGAAKHAERKDRHTDDAEPCLLPDAVGDGGDDQPAAKRRDRRSPSRAWQSVGRDDQTPDQHQSCHYTEKAQLQPDLDRRVMWMNRAVLEKAVRCPRRLRHVKAAHCPEAETDQWLFTCRNGGAVPDLQPVCKRRREKGDIIRNPDHQIAEQPRCRNHQQYRERE